VVLWIAERQDVLSTCFALLLILYVCTRARKRRRAWRLEHTACWCVRMCAACPSHGLAGGGFVAGSGICRCSGGPTGHTCGRRCPFSCSALAAVWRSFPGQDRARQGVRCDLLYCRWSSLLHQLYLWKRLARRLVADYPLPSLSLTTSRCGRRPLRAGHRGIVLSPSTRAGWRGAVLLIAIVHARVSFAILFRRGQLGPCYRPFFGLLCRSPGGMIVCGAWARAPFERGMGGNFAPLF